MRTILVVDDENLITTTISSFLQRSANDLSVLATQSGTEAIEVLRQRHIDLLLTDLNMPVKDGYEVIDVARMLHPDMPILAMSGAVSSEGLSRLCDRGVHDCLEKPFDFHHLVRLVRERLAGVAPLPCHRAFHSA